MDDSHRNDALMVRSDNEHINRAVSCFQRLIWSPVSGMQYIEGRETSLTDNKKRKST